MATNRDINRAIIQKELDRRAALDQQFSGISSFEITDVPLDSKAIEETFRLAPKQQPPGAIRQTTSLTPPLRNQIPGVAGFLTQETLGGHLLRKTPQIAGGAIGGAIGAAIPTMGEEPALVAGGTALGNFVLGPLGSTLGGAIGRATTLSPSDPQYVSKLTNAALEEGLGDFGGRLLTGLAGRALLRPFRRAVEPGAEIADKVLRSSGKLPISTTLKGKVSRSIQRRVVNVKELFGGEPGSAVRIADKFGSHILPGAATESVMDTIQGVAEGSFVSGGKLRRFRGQSIPTALRNSANKLKVSVRANLIKELGEKKANLIINDLSSADATAINAVEKSLYSAVDELNAVPTDIRSLKRFATENRGVGLKPGARERMFRQVERKPDTQTFAQLRKIRADAWQEHATFTRAGAGENARAAKNLALRTDKLMEAAAEASGNPQLKAAFRTADTFHRGKLRTEWLESFLVKTSQADEAPGKSFATKIMKMSIDVNNKPSELVKMGFSARDINQIRGVAQAAIFARKQAEGGGRMLIQLAQGGQILGLLGAAGGAASDNSLLTGAGMLLMIGPELAARMMLSPTGSKILTSGLRAPAGSKDAGILVMRFMREAAYHNTQMEAEGGLPGLFLRKIRSVKQPKQVTAPTGREIRIAGQGTRF